MEAKGLKINVEKTKVMRSGKGSGGIEKMGNRLGQKRGYFQEFILQGCKSPKSCEWVSGTHP